MRSTFAGLNTMVKGIYSNQLSQQTVGHNISNANTEGYSRQKVNLAATPSQEQSSVYGTILVGTGVDSIALTRARDLYADRQYWSENSNKTYYEGRAKEYDKLEVIFDDSGEHGIEDAMAKFYEAWQTLSISASDSSARISTLERGKSFADKLHTVTQQLQEQIEANYDDITMNVGKVNEMLGQVVLLNKNIAGLEATGGSANDLRDERDLLIDKLSEYVNVNIYENDDGMYTIVSNGITLVNGVTKLTLAMSDPTYNSDYGVTDYDIVIKESKVKYEPIRGSLRAEFDAIAEDKEYIDKMANIASFMLSDLNEQHQQGHGIDTNSTAGINFFGDKDTIYEWDTTNLCLKSTSYSGGISVTARTVAVNPNYPDPSDPNHYYVASTVTGSGTATVTNKMNKIDIIASLALNNELTTENGHLLVAASGYSFELDANGNPVIPANPGDFMENGSGDGSNSVLLGTLFNMDMTKTPKYDRTATAAQNEAKRSIGTISLNSYYVKIMTELGTRAEAMDTNVETQVDVLTQIVEWRESTAGVNWNEELSNMIMFQQGFSSCSRCLTTMDEMLDRLINNTGVVGR